MSLTGHLSVRKGQRVMVHLKSGHKVIAKFIEHKHSYIDLEDPKDGAFSIWTKDIRTISIYKGEAI